MAVRLAFDKFALLLLFLCIVVVGAIPPKVFDVVKYGAVADGKKDNRKAFTKAWKDACAYEGRSRIYIPRGTFMLGSVSFEGSCNGTMTFIIKGTLKATSDPGLFFTDTWIAFRYLTDLTVKGGGVLDGQGHAAWRYNDCQTNSNCKPLPVTMRFDFVKNSTVYNIRSINSKSSHFNLFACENMELTQIRLTAPASSPNTDGIRIGISSKINISHVVIGTGDDCISMVSGSQDIDILDVACGPGHGISVGSLGRSHSHEYVQGISVRNVTFIGTDNGVRIKTWSPSLYSVASNILFEDIVMRSTRNPIVIDQHYCPSTHCYLEGSSSAVQIRDVTFKNIRGTSSSKIAVNLQCSGSTPCENVKLININLAYNGSGGGEARASCSNVIGSSFGKLVPDGCI